MPSPGPVRLPEFLSALCCAALCACLPAALAQPAVPANAPTFVPDATPGDAGVLEARDALRRKDRVRLATLRAGLIAEQHPLAMWVDYWELGLRLPQAQQEDLDAFYARWPGSYLEDRLRNDWLLELGRRRDWEHYALEQPRFRMQDDRDVACYTLLVQHQQGSDVREAARSAWQAQRDADEGCALMAQTLYAAGRFVPTDIWRKARLSLDAGRPRAAAQALEMIGGDASRAWVEIVANPVRYLSKHPEAQPRAKAELATLALQRVAVNDPDVAARLLDERWSKALPAELAAWAWASTGRQSAQQLQPQALDAFRRADERLAAASRADARDTTWSDDTLAWKARAAVRASAWAKGAPPVPARWPQVLEAVDAMSAAEQRDPAWVYWKARAMLATAADTDQANAQRAAAREQLADLATQSHFYGLLAAEDLGRPLVLPPRPAPLTPAEREVAAAQPSLNRALQLVALGLRSEGVREWNYGLRGLDDRALLAAAQRACDAAVWDRCINTSERTRGEFDIAQRFPTPNRAAVVARSRDVGLDAAYVYGLIRQESRFIADARSGVGASGWMQLMPATARWAARRAGVDYSDAALTDRDQNLRLGTFYLKYVLDDFDGSQALAAAAYNAGPGRPRRWRDGPVLEVAAWAENVPFLETRDYVKKVLTNATYYAAVLGQQVPSLKARLGRPIGPRDANEPPPNTDLP